MNIGIKLFFVLAGLMLLASCLKDDEPKFVDEASGDVIKYRISLTEDLQIHAYSKYRNGGFVDTTFFIDQDSIIERITLNSNAVVKRRIIYRLDGDEYARSSIDTNFEGMTVSRTEYSYKNGYLVRSIDNWYTIGETDTIRLVLEYEIKDGNISGMIESPGAGLGYTTHFDYNNLQNKLDVRDFSNGITGKIAKNLLSHVDWRTNLGAAPSTTSADSDYEYDMDPSGFVIEMTEIYTPGYHFEAETVTRTVYTTLYEYDMIMPGL
jgi:hypothetical protein